MSPLLARSLLRVALAVAATGTAFAAAPQPAAAKTFVASFDDESGDGGADAHDVVHARVAYNRRTGALSATVQMAGPIADDRDDAVVLVYLSNLENGRCKRGLMTLGGRLSDPSVAVAWPGIMPGKRRWLGTGSVEEDTLKMRVRAKGLSGKQPGCTAVVVTTHDGSETIFDQTSGVDGFA